MTIRALNSFVAFASPLVITEQMGHCSAGFFSIARFERKRKK